MASYYVVTNSKNTILTMLSKHCTFRLVPQINVQHVCLYAE